VLSRSNTKHGLRRLLLLLYEGLNERDEHIEDDDDDVDNNEREEERDDEGDRGGVFVSFFRCSKTL